MYYFFLPKQKTQARQKQRVFDPRLKRVMEYIIFRLYGDRIICDTFNLYFYSSATFTTDDVLKIRKSEDNRSPETQNGRIRRREEKYSPRAARDIVFGIGHSETLYHRPTPERERLPKAKTLRQIFD